jgi:hypothetical protein
MSVLKVQLPQTTYEQLLTVADRAWRPAAWHAEWLLRKAIEAELARMPEDCDDEHAAQAEA